VLCSLAVLLACKKKERRDGVVDQKTDSPTEELRS
jgi:hypothetical protein